jgi:tetratricopeptide (TPR) repeat protein
MQTNYKTIEHQIRKYSFEFLKVSEVPLIMLENLNEINPEMIDNAKKPNLLAAAIIFVFLRKSRLNGRGGITAKDVGKYFDVKPAAISQKAFDVESWLYADEEFALDSDSDIYEFIDKDRFKVNELYWEFTESPDSENIKKGIKTLKSIIKKDPDYFDPYITLHEYYLMDGDFKNAIKIIETGFKRAIDLIDNNGRFPDSLPWGFIENRHIIRMIFNFAMFVWANDENKDIALKIFMELLKSNHNDNIGARYSIVAILEGFSSQEEWEEKFAGDIGLDYMAVENWFYKAAEKHRDVIGWWLDLEEDEM